VEFRARVFVVPKPAILDPQGKAIEKSLAALGFDGVREVRLGKLVLLRLEAQSEQDARDGVEQMCKRLLANEVIEDFSFELECVQR